MSKKMLGDLMRQAQKLQEEMMKTQEEAKKKTAEASAGGGMVTVKVSGALEVKEIRIAPEAIDPGDPELLADTILAAVNEGIRSAQSLAESRMSGMLGGLKELGLPDL